MTTQFLFCVCRWDCGFVGRQLKGLRDRAAIAIMAYTFARVSAVVGLSLGDYRHQGKRARLKLMEKRNKEKLVWLHREAEEFLDTYIKDAGLDDAEAPLFQSLDKAHRLTGEALLRRDMLDVANHSDPRTTKLYDRRKDLATLSEIERRIAFE